MDTNIPIDTQYSILNTQLYWNIEAVINNPTEMTINDGDNTTDNNR